MLNEGLYRILELAFNIKKVVLRKFRKEPQNAYTPLFTPEKSAINLKNEHFWQVF